MREQDFSTELHDWLEDDSPKTLGCLQDVFDERGFAVAILLLLFPSALPIPTGGVTHVLEFIALLLGLEMVLGRREIWLPARWNDRDLGAFLTNKALPFVVRRIRWFERWSHPRLPHLYEQGWFLRLLGGLFVVLTLGAIIAPPFSGLDTLPSLGAVMVALSILLRDALLLAAGVVVGLAGVALTLALGSAAFRFGRGLV